MSRYEELKNKGWKNLSKEEREEYKNLKGDDNEEDTITISKDKLEGILSRLSFLENKENKKTIAGVEWEVVEQDLSLKTATLRCLDDKYCVGLWHYKTEWNDRTREKDLIYKFKWLLPNGEYEETEMNLTDFARDVPRVTVKLIDKKIETLRKKTGKSIKIEPDYTNFRSKQVGIVDSYVTKDEITYVAELPDGRKIELPSEKFNN